MLGHQPAADGVPVLAVVEAAEVPARQGAVPELLREAPDKANNKELLVRGGGLPGADEAVLQRRLDRGVHNADKQHEGDEGHVAAVPELLREEAVFAEVHDELLHDPTVDLAVLGREPGAAEPVRQDQRAVFEVQIGGLDEPAPEGDPAGEVQHGAAAGEHKAGVRPAAAAEHGGGAAGVRPAGASAQGDKLRAV